MAAKFTEGEQAAQGFEAVMDAAVRVSAEDYRKFRDDQADQRKPKKAASKALQAQLPKHPRSS